MKYNEEYYKKVKKLADHIVSCSDPKMKWMWGEALLGYALDELDKENGSQDYTKFLCDYCDYWVNADPSIDQSDTAAPGLITYAMYKRTSRAEYKKLTEKVLDYIRYEPRLYLDCLNHLGCSKKGKFYPKSVWIDSVMMFSVFTSLYAKESGDKELLDFAARQPKQYAAMMFDNDKKLWSHSYWVKSGRAFPKNDLFWGRGNGWVICGFPMILDNIGLDHSEAQTIISLFQQTSMALIECARDDGAFNTLLKHKSYRELSATALISAGWLHGIRCGYLDRKFLEPAIKAFETCVNAIEENEHGVFMTEISGPTIPLPFFPKLGYTSVPLGKNWSYGVASLIFAAIEYKKCLQENIPEFATNNMTDLNMLSITTATSISKYIPSYMIDQLLTDGSSSTYLAFPSILKISDEKVLIAYKASTAHMDVEADLDLIVFNPTTKQVISKTTIDGTVGEAAQNPEIMQMPNGDIVIYVDVQRVSKEGQQRYGVKQIRSTDGGNTWKVLAADGIYKNVEEVPKHCYSALTDDKGIIYGYTFDDVTVNGTVYMLAMSFPDFASAPGRSVHVIKSDDNGESWTHVKNLTTTFNIKFNESTIEAYDGGFIINCRRDSDGGKKGVTYRVDADFNVLAKEDYSAYSNVIKTTQRPKLFVENGKYYLMGRNILDGATTLGLYEIEPKTLAPLNYIELKNLPGYSSGNSFYAEYYLQEENGITYFNVITYDDTQNKGKPNIVRYEYLWEELLNQKDVGGQMA